MTTHKAVFLDKDGTLIPDIPYNVDPEQITLYPDAGSALQALQKAGFKLLIVSNQAGVARGYFPEVALVGVEDRLRQLLHEQEITLDGFHYCPHHPAGSVAEYAVECTCRKPQPGMLTNLAQQQDIDLRESWMIGDILNDVEAGNRAGCRTILVDRGNETEWIVGPFRTPTATVSSLQEAADIIHKSGSVANVVSSTSLAYQSGDVLVTD